MKGNEVFNDIVWGETCNRAGVSVKRRMKTKGEVSESEKRNVELENHEANPEKVFKQDKSHSGPRARSLVIVYAIILTDRSS